MTFFSELRDLQGNACGMCGISSAADGGLVVDHDHNTGFVRGYLCRSCNQLEGRHVKCAGPNIFCPVCMWRMTPAVAWLGRTERYESPFGLFGEDEFRSQPFATSIERVANEKAKVGIRREITNTVAALLDEPMIATAPHGGSPSEQVPPASCSSGTLASTSLPLGADVPSAVERAPHSALRPKVDLRGAS